MFNRIDEVARVAEIAWIDLNGEELLVIWRQLVHEFMNPGYGVVRRAIVVYRDLGDSCCLTENRVELFDDERRSIVRAEEDFGTKIMWRAISGGGYRLPRHVRGDSVPRSRLLSDRHSR